MTVATSFCRRVHWAEIHETTRPRGGRTNGASTAPPMSGSSAATFTTPRGPRATLGADGGVVAQGY